MKEFYVVGTPAQLRFPEGATLLLTKYFNSTLVHKEFKF